MIITVEQAKALIDLTSWKDEKILMKLKAIEQTIRAYTNNNFQDRECRAQASIVNGALVLASAIPLAADDTIQVSESRHNNGLYTITSARDTAATVSEKLNDEDAVLVTRIAYPADVVDCALNMLEWEINNRAKVGVQSETLSRHSVTYFNMDGGNSVMGYPASLLGCLKAYRKVRC